MAVTPVLKRSLVMVAMVMAAVACVPAHVAAQSAPQPAPARTSNLWLTAGGGYTSQKGDCSNCTPGEVIYVKSGNLLIDAGFRANAQLDGAVELTWAPSQMRTGDDIRVTYLMGVGQYRPLKNHGFFVKGGMGVAFVRNWVFDVTNDVTPAFTTNAMALTYGAGWEVRSRGRFGLQVFGQHHVVALGDLSVTGGLTAEDVIGNMWTLGASIVIR
jgi:hypothetical protein